VTVTDVTPGAGRGRRNLVGRQEYDAHRYSPLQAATFLNVFEFSPGVVSGSYAGQVGVIAREWHHWRFDDLPDRRTVRNRPVHQRICTATPQALQTIQELKVTTSNAARSMERRVLWMW